MGIDLNDGQRFHDIMEHIDHDIKVVRYGTENLTVNAAIECETCGCILVSDDNPNPPTREEIAADRKATEDKHKRYAEVEKLNDVTRKQMQTKIDAALGEECEVYYSAYESDEDGLIRDNLDDIAVEGCVRFTYDGGFGDRSFRSPVLQSPTWLQVCGIAEEAIRISGDHHHVFLEGIGFTTQEEGEGGQTVAVYELSFGS